MPPKRTGSELIAHDVFHKLRSRILTLDLRPGSRLVEEDICELLKAGRTPVREALLRLEGEGLVHRQRGWVVHESDPAHYRSLFETRIAIEGYASRLAATRASAADVAGLEGIVDEMGAVERLPRSEVNRLNQAFHRRIVELSDNEFFVEMHERTQFRHWNLRVPIMLLPDQLARSMAEHREIVAALGARDGDRAERAARSHIESTLRIVADALHDE